MEGFDLKLERKTQDITPKSTEDDLRSSFTAILDNQEEFILSVDGKIIGSNLEAVSVSGYEEWEVIGNYFSMFYTPEEIESDTHLSHLYQASVSGVTIIEGWKLKKQSIKFFARLQFIAMRDYHNKLTGYRLRLTDITNEELYGDKLSKINEKYLGIYNNAFVGILTLSAKDLQIIHCNDKARSILENKTNLRDVFESSTAFQLFKSKLSHSEVVQGFEFQCVSNDPMQRWISIDCHLYPSENIIEGVIVDISTVKRQYLEITRLKDEVNSFIYHASHELRAPMSTMLGLINLLAMEKQEDQVVSNYLGLIKERIAFQDELLKSLTGIVYNNTAAIAVDEFNYSVEVESILSEFKPLYPDVKVKVEIKDTYNTKTDAIRVRTILRSIISNAFKFGTKFDPFIMINVTRNQNQTVITVEDNGLGISEDQLILIFNLFHKLHSGYSSNGLGLYLAKSIVNTLGGEIKINSKKACGTKVQIFLK